MNKLFNLIARTVQQHCFRTAHHEEQFDLAWDKHKHIFSKSIESYLIIPVVKFDWNHSSSYQVWRIILHEILSNIPSIFYQKLSTHKIGWKLKVRWKITIA